VPAVLILAGISEARLIVDEISKIDIGLAVAVTSRLGGNWLNQYDGVAVRKGRLTFDEMKKFIDSTKAICLIDAFAAIPGFRNRFYAWAFPESSAIVKWESFGLNAEHIIAMSWSLYNSLIMLQK
jgi:hypothetical protein